MTIDTRATMPHRWLTILLVALVVTVLDPGRPAFACSCAPPLPPQQELAESSAVFAGEVVATEELNGGQPDSELVARVAVTEVWKGEVHEVVEVRTAADGAMCGVGFEVGREMLIYAGVGDDDRFGTHLCTRTASLDRAEEDLAALGPGDAPLPGERFGEDGRDWPLPLLVAALILAGAGAGVLLSRRRRQP